MKESLYARITSRSCREKKKDKKEKLKIHETVLIELENNWSRCNATTCGSWHNFFSKMKRMRMSGRRRKRKRRRRRRKKRLHSGRRAPTQFRDGHGKIFTCSNIHQSGPETAVSLCLHYYVNRNGGSNNTSTSI